MVTENLTENAIPSNGGHKVFYGDSDEVTPFVYTDYNDYLKTPKKKQPMKGFDETYDNFIDYIIKITHWIWEEKGIGLIYDTYHNNIVMHFGSYNVSGIKEVVSGTFQALHAFPDRKLIGQNVIWSKYEGDGFFSSHRIMSVATNLGQSPFGPATGKKVTYRTVADCVAHSNRIHEEWLVRDNLGLIKQLGFDPHEVARKMAKATSNKAPAFQSHFGVSEAVHGQIFPKLYKAKDSSVGEFVLEMVNRIYEYRLFNEVENYYADNAVVHYICDKDLSGYEQIQGMLVSFFASFPNAKYSVDRVTCNQRMEANKWDVAVRWRLCGLHEGIGYFGDSTGKPVEILGVSHLYIADGKIQEEWVTFDGLDVLRQIYLDSQESDEKTDYENES